MEKSKIIVDTMPQKSENCPFAIPCDDTFFPCVCDLKRDKAARFGISFSTSQYDNCSLDTNKTCDMLASLSNFTASQVEEEPMTGLEKRLRKYAAEYRKQPTGKEVDGTPELLEQAAQVLSDTQRSLNHYRQKFIEGLPVHSTGDDESDGIECPSCGYEVARNDDYDEMRPNYCPECGTKLIY